MPTLYAILAGVDPLLGGLCLAGSLAQIRTLAVSDGPGAPRPTRHGMDPKHRALASALGPGKGTLHG